MSEFVQQVEWSGSKTVLVRLGGVPTSPLFPGGVATKAKYRTKLHRRVDRVIIHQSDGGAHEGLKAVERLAAYFTARPTFSATGKVVGGGRGWPGIAYTFVVPGRLVLYEGKFAVYRIWDDDWETWHTKGENDRGVGVVVCGQYESRHAPSRSASARPNPSVMVALEELVLGYLLPRYGVPADGGLFGHFDFSKPACPGDFLEAWVRRQRGEAFAPGETDPVDRPAPDRKFMTAAERQRALVDLGYDLGPSGADGAWGLKSRTALEAFQRDAGILPDGVWGPRTAAAIEKALDAPRPLATG